MRFQHRHDDFPLRKKASLQRDEGRRKAVRWSVGIKCCEKVIAGIDQFSIFTCSFPYIDFGLQLFCLITQALQHPADNLWRGRDFDRLITFSFSPSEIVHEQSELVAKVVTQSIGLIAIFLTGGMPNSVDP